MEQKPVYSLSALTRYFLKLGSIGFGGPVALVGYMHKDLVEENQWISDKEYKQGLALAQLMPGPLAAQLAIYLGFVHYRIFWGYFGRYSICTTIFCNGTIVGYVVLGILLRCFIR